MTYRILSASSARKDLFQLIDEVSALKEELVYIQTRRGRVAMVPAEYAEHLVSAMTWDLDTFRSRVRAPIWGAMHHYVAIRLGELNRKPALVQHWTTEVDRLIDIELPDVLQHNVSSSAKAKRKAALAAVAFLRTLKDGAPLKTAVTKGTNHWISAVNKGKRPRVAFPAEDWETFFARVLDVIDASLP
jgi:hypothetical protein